MTRLTKQESIKAISKDTRTIRFIASHQFVDRDSELVLVSGIETQQFELNPLLLMQHDYRGAAVGRVQNLQRTLIEGAPALTAEAVFPKGDPDSDAALEKVRVGLLNGISIGFQSLQQGPPQLPGQQGRTHLRTNLLEVSLVNLPSCPTCLVTAKCACPTKTPLVREEPVLELVENLMFELKDEPRVDVDERELNHLIGRAITDSVGKLALKAVQEEIDYQHGRVGY